MRRRLAIVGALAALGLLAVLLAPREAPELAGPLALDSAEIAAQERPAAELTAPAVAAPGAPAPAVPALAEREPDGRAPAAEPAPERVPVTVLVAEERGLPVAGARVRLRVGTGTWSPVGTTDERGALEVAVPRGEVVLLRANAPDCREDGVRSRPPHAPVLRIALETTGPIRGTVRWTDGTRVGAGLEVRAAATVDGRPFVATALTGRFGDFEIEDLDLAREFRVSVWGEHVVSIETVKARPSVTPLRLEVGALWGVLVRLVEADGAPLRELPDARYQLPRRFRQRPKRGDPAVLDLERAVAAGLPAHLAEPRFDRRLVLLAGPREAEAALEPVRVAVDVAGYAPTETEVVPRPLAAGLSEVELALRRLAVDRLELEVRLPRLPRLPEDARWPEALLVLASEGGGSVQYDLPLRPGRAVLEALPVGSYRARVRIPPTWDLWPEEGIEVVIGAGTGAPAELDLRHLGGLVLRVSEPWTLLGASSQTELRSLVSVGEGRGDPAPSVVLLPPGDYLLWPRSAEHGQVDVEERAAARALTVRAGETTEMDLR